MGSGISSDANDVRKTLFWSAGADSVLMPLIKNNQDKI